MLPIQCDDNTAAAIIIDDVTEISMTEEDWEISGRPTIGDTISFDVVGEGDFVDAFNGMRYLITDEYERDGFHIVSFVEAPQDDPALDSFMGASEDHEPDTDDSEGGDLTVDEIENLRLFPGITAPQEQQEQTNGEGDSKGSDQVSQVSIKNVPSMRLIGTLMRDHGMSMHDIVAGLVAMENEDASDTINDDVIVDFFEHNSDSIRDISSDFATYSKQVAQSKSMGAGGL